METQGRLEDFVTSASNTGKDELKQKDFIKHHGQPIRKELTGANNFNFGTRFQNAEESVSSIIMDQMKNVRTDVWQQKNNKQRD